jgi:hypothetical protein
MRGWPAAIIAFYGPDASRATKVAVGIVMRDEEEPQQMRDWSTASGDVGNNAAVAAEMLGFIEQHGGLSIIMSDGILGYPHQIGIDYSMLSISLFREEQPRCANNEMMSSRLPRGTGL